MKRISYWLLCAAVFMITACSDNDSKPAVKKDELGMIVPQSNASENVLLLENGTLTRPVSGITDFASRGLGEKLLISYRTLGVDKGITNIAVTHFSEANDSTFTPDPQPNDTLTLEESVYEKTYSGRYYIANQDSTEVFFGNISISFGEEELGRSSYSYTITPDAGEWFSGEGEFDISGQTIDFSNNEHDNIIVPLGDFVASYGVGSLYLWPVEFNGLFCTYALSVDE